MKRRPKRYMIFFMMAVHDLERFEMLLFGLPNESWTLCFIAEYPSVLAFVAMHGDPAYLEAVKHRQAALIDSRLIRYAPSAPGADFSV